MKFKSILIYVLFLSSCAAYKSFNQTTTGVASFRGGVSQDKTWDSTLVFKRMSWYHGMTLYFDALLYRADQYSDFSLWFSEDEKQYFNKCQSLIVTVSYSADPTKISHSHFREQMLLNGYDDVVINQFASSVKTHPAYHSWNLQNYRIMGYCKRSMSKMRKTDELIINFPSFNEHALRL